MESLEQRLVLSSSTPSAGFTPLQIQTAYGLSTGSAYNNNITFGGIKGDGTGQTIGIFEEGYNPAFVDTSGSGNFSYQRPGGLRQDLRPARPAQPDLRRPHRQPLSASNNSSNNPDFDTTAPALEIALDIEWAHAMAPGAKHRRPLRPCHGFPLTITSDIPAGMATLAGLPGVSVVSASYGWFLDDFGQERLEQSWDSTILQPALAANPNVSFFAASGDYGRLRVDLPVRLARGRRRSAARACLSRAAASGATRSAGPTPVSLTAAAGTARPSRYRPTSRTTASPATTACAPTPDVAADADPTTGVAVYDPYDFGTATPWVAGRRHQPGDAAVGRHGRDRRPGPRPRRRPAPRRHRDADGPLRPGQLAPGDFHDITQGNKRLPRRSRLRPGHRPGLAQGQPPHPRPGRLRPGQQGDHRHPAAPQRRPRAPASASSPTATDSFGVTDLSYNGTATLTLASGPSGATFTPVTVPVTDGMAVFQNLSLSKKGSGYTFQVAMTGLTSATTSPVAVIAPKSGVGYFYPLPLANSLEAAVAAADSNSDASNIITLSVSSIPYPVTGGQLVIDNSSSLKSKTFTIVGQGESSSVIDAESTSRVFEIVGTSSGLSVVMQGLAIDGGRATDGGILGGGAALGGGLLIDGGNVALSNVAVMNNAASGAAGAAGAVGRSATAGHPTGGPGGNGGDGGNARGGGIYLAAGNLTLTNDLIQGNVAQGGAGGAGGAGGSRKARARWPRVRWRRRQRPGRRHLPVRRQPRPEQRPDPGQPGPGRRW